MKSSATERSKQFYSSAVRQAVGKTNMSNREPWNRPYDFGDFIEGVKDKNWLEMIEIADRVCADTERQSSMVKGAKKAREQGSMKYVAQLKEFLWFLRTQSKPMTVSPYNFKLYKKVAENLVAKGQWLPAVLEIFT